MSWDSDHHGSWPFVSFVVLMPSGMDDAARASLASARSQHYPDRAFEVVTADSVEDGLERTFGDWIAILRAGETWLPDKTVTQAKLLADRPGVGLVYGDTVDSTFAIRPPRAGEDALGCLLFGPLGAPSTLLVRTDIARSAFSMPVLKPCPFWWLSFRAAELAGVDYVTEPVADAALDTPDAPIFRRSLLARAEAGTVPTHLALAALEALPPLPPIGNPAHDRAQAAIHDVAGRRDLAVSHLIRALALDPTDERSAESLIDVLGREESIAA